MSDVLWKEAAESDGTDSEEDSICESVAQANNKRNDIEDSGSEYSDLEYEQKDIDALFGGLEQSLSDDEELIFENENIEFVLPDLDETQNDLSIVTQERVWKQGKYQSQFEGMIAHFVFIGRKALTDIEKNFVQAIISLHCIFLILTMADAESLRSGLGSREEKYVTPMMRVLIFATRCSTMKLNGSYSVPDSLNFLFTVEKFKSFNNPEVKGWIKSLPEFDNNQRLASMIEASRSILKVVHDKLTTFGESGISLYEGKIAEARKLIINERSEKAFSKKVRESRGGLPSDTKT